MRHRSMFLARLALRRRPLVYWALTGVLALATALVVGGMVARADRAAARYGDPQPVLVATVDIAAGDPVTEAAVEIQTIPGSLVPDGAMAAVPDGRVALATIYAGEPVVEARIAPDGLRGVAALLPADSRALAVPTGPGSLRLAVGDTVDVMVTTGPALVEGTGTTGDTVASGALVVDVADETVTVAVDESDAPDVAAARTQGTVTLALSGSDH